MGNHHYEKWILKTMIGMLLTAGGVFLMYYAITHSGKIRWVYYGIGCSVIITFGIYMLSTAAINKVKSDMIKRQKQKQQAG
jgi:bacteriorhodopsin